MSFQEELWKPNKLVCGDNLEELAKFPEESVDLIYIDPPFFTHRQYEVVWGDEAEVRSYTDRWEGGIQHYISWLKPRVQLMYRVLKPTGSFYLHCDWHANAYIRIMLDEIFGEDNFRNEIVWCYKTRHFSKNGFGKKHDTIYFYSKSEHYIFHWEAVLRPLSVNTVKKYKYHDEKGYYRLDGRGIKGSPIQSAKDVNPSWEKTNPELVSRSYLKDGVPVEDYWLIDIINQASKERLGYPTQKPEELLERIIQASSNKGDVVADFFCGCGTTIAVAQRLGRRWIGVDISPTAIKVIKDRFKKGLEGKGPKVAMITEGIDYVVSGMPTTLDGVRKLEPFEFQNWVVIDKMEANASRKKVGDMGLDGYMTKNLYHDAAGIQVKQSDSVGRNVIDNFETALKRAGYEIGYIVAFSFTRDAYEEVARIKNKGELNIHLVTVKDLIEKQKLKGLSDD